jgi:uncharacterized protein YegJ (DUF2314 family)
MHIRTRGRIAGLAFIACAFIATNAVPSTGPARASGGDPRDALTADRTDVNYAQTLARQHLSRFFEHVLAHDGNARADAAVKVAIPVGKSRSELVWVTPFARVDDGFVGVLATAPEALTDLDTGDLVTFGQDQVRDWSFHGPDGKLYGSYTTRVMLATINSAQAAEIATLLSDDPLPSDW